MASLDTTTQARLEQVRNRIERAALAAGRSPEQVTLVAVSKTFGPALVQQAIAVGQRRFGENYVQEARDKIAAVASAGSQEAVEWHFIGPIQSNKTRELADTFDWIQSLDRLKIAQRLNQQRSPTRPALNVLLQVNISGEASKRGALPQDLPDLARQIAALPRLRLRGLMAIPEPTREAARQHAPFARMRELLEQLRGDLAATGGALDTLSMGMSDDLEAAIAEGSTMVRVGTAIFGARS
jgi:pyridoxal phosphate enzyme (YggS family)